MDDAAPPVSLRRWAQDPRFRPARVISAVPVVTRLVVVSGSSPQISMRPTMVCELASNGSMPMTRANAASVAVSQPAQ